MTPCVTAVAQSDAVADAVHPTCCSRDEVVHIELVGTRPLIALRVLATKLVAAQNLRAHCLPIRFLGL